MTASGLEVVVAFVGLQASGKSTYYRCCFAATHDHTSKDAWPNASIRDCLARNQRRQGRARVPQVAGMTTDGTFELHAVGGG